VLVKRKADICFVKTTKNPDVAFIDRSKEYRPTAG